MKSCVGETWCRYGVQDSVGLAIGLELRYRGLRAPHKLKSAVSGCARECAEAQSKDFGVIATETGWNLYVGGNGGCRPRHADLFAADLDDDDADPHHRPVPDVLHPHRRPAGAHRRLARGGSTAAWTTSAPSSSTTRSGSAPNWTRRWTGTSTATRTSGRRCSTTPNGCAASSPSSTPPTRPTPPITFVPERGQIRPARPDEHGTILSPALVAGPRLEVRTA